MDVSARISLVCSPIASVSAARACACVRGAAYLHPEESFDLRVLELEQKHATILALGNTLPGGTLREDLKNRERIAKRGRQR